MGIFAWLRRHFGPKPAPALHLVFTLKPLRFTEEDLDVATRTLVGEARGESFDGLIAVAWCIRNRVEADLHGDGKPDWWGEGITAVCMKKWQFSCWWDEQAPRLRKWPTSDQQYLRCRDAARLVFKGQAPDPTNGATHYCTLESNPAWSRGKRPSKVIGNHKFYNNVE